MSWDVLIPMGMVRDPTTLACVSSLMRRWGRRGRISPLRLPLLPRSEEWRRALGRRRPRYDSDGPALSCGPHVSTGGARNLRAIPRQSGGVFLLLLATGDTIEEGER